MISPASLNLSDKGSWGLGLLGSVLGLIGAGNNRSLISNYSINWES